MADPRQVAARFVEVFNAHDEEGLRELNADNTVFEAPGDVRLEGREPATQYALAWLRAFPDARLRIRTEHEAGEWIVQQFTFEGTHSDTLSTPGGDIPATNRRLTGRGVQLVRVHDGAIAETQLYFDQVQVLTQLGLMPQMATA